MVQIGFLLEITTLLEMEETTRAEEWTRQGLDSEWVQRYDVPEGLDWISVQISYRHSGYIIQELLKGHISHSEQSHSVLTAKESSLTPSPAWNSIPALWLVATLSSLLSYCSVADTTFNQSTNEPNWSCRGMLHYCKTIVKGARFGLGCTLHSCTGPTVGLCIPISYLAYLHFL